MAPPQAVGSGRQASPRRAHRSGSSSSLPPGPSQAELSVEFGRGGELDGSLEKPDGLVGGGYFGQPGQGAIAKKVGRGQGHGEGSAARVLEDESGRLEGGLGQCPLEVGVGFGPALELL